ncbi:MAG: 16S rRNA (adenine(1518)-N(6)/adenine(1519)-N(6))-dimethyltransferase RsmA [Bacteroidetes bacterium]|nr:16S rRNA (adenine(1518)-N(6)/adenine(1519)-N(6))-dimethyltransferase RsmA [Bacteroidota bacterium]
MTHHDYSSSDSKINALPTLGALVGALDMRARKSLGQNFLFDLTLTRRIARSGGSLHGTTIEVGPGPGGLTRALLLEGAEKVIAIEKDFRAGTVLGSLLEAAEGRLSLVEADALKTPIWEIGEAPRRVIANLPYNIATTLLLQWLEHTAAFESLTLMFQREVAERITARPGDSAYGRLSILTGWLADAEIQFDIPPEAFVPAPKVTSSVVHIRPLAKPRYACDQSALEQITRLAFGQRRKMLRASLKSIGGAAMLTDAGINPEARPQEIDIEGFCRLANIVGSQV